MSDKQCNGGQRASYYFRPVVAEDLPFLLQGLQDTEVRRWWGEPEFELSLIRGDLMQNDALRGDAAGPLIDLRIVLADHVPVAFIQDYAVSDWPCENLMHLPPGTRALDTFIVSHTAMGQGHCSRYLKHRAQVLLQHNCPLVIIDPDPENTRAIRAYAKAGFSLEHEHSRSYADSMVMVYNDG